MVRHVQKIRVLQVSIASRLARPELIGIDDRFHRAVAGIVKLKLHAAHDILEMPAHPRHHHMARSKLGRRVSCFKSPRRHRLILTTSPECDRYPISRCSDR